MSEKSFREIKFFWQRGGVPWLGTTHFSKGGKIFLLSQDLLSRREVGGALIMQRRLAMLSQVRKIFIRINCFCSVKFSKNDQTAFILYQEILSGKIIL